MKLRMMIKWKRMNFILMKNLKEAGELFGILLPLKVPFINDITYKKWGPTLSPDKKFDIFKFQKNGFRLFLKK